MAHWDLLPTADDLIRELIEEQGLTLEQAHGVLHAVQYHLTMYCDYYDDQWKMHGDDSDKGAGAALRQVALDLDEATRHS